MSQMQQFDDSQLIEFEDLSGALFDHNNRFSKLGLSFKGMAQFISTGDFPDNSKTCETESSMKAIERLNGSHKNILLALGFELRPFTSSRSLDTKAGEGALSNLVAISFFDPNRFSSFLETIPDGVTNDERINNIVTNLASSLSNYLSNEFILLDLETQTSFVVDFKLALNHFKRLNIEKRVHQDIEFYLDSFDNKVLPQAIEIHQLRLILKPDDEFSPAEWVLSASVEFLESMWQGALDELEKLCNGDNEHNLRREVAINLLDCCRASLDWIQANRQNSENGMDPKKADDFIEIIEGAKEELEHYI